MNDSRVTPAVLARRRLTHPDGRQFDLYGDTGVDMTLDGESDPGQADRRSIQRRFDRLTGSWVLIAPRRNTRPGGNVDASDTPSADTSGTCPLCPGGPELPLPFEVAVFDNRFPSLAPNATDPERPWTAGSTGRCQVVVYTPDHCCRSLTDLSGEQLIELVTVLRDRTQALWAEGYDYVMAFENRGAAVGATLDHLHGQIYAFGHLPPVTATKLAQHRRHRRDGQLCLGCTLAREADRQIVANDTFLVAVPFAPRWPYEVQVLARRHGLRRLGDLTDGELIDLAGALHDVVGRYDALFDMPLPFMMCVQEAPAGGDDWHLHVEFMPPHRSADRLKVRASVETSLECSSTTRCPSTAPAASPISM